MTTLSMDKELLFEMSAAFEICVTSAIFDLFNTLRKFHIKHQILSSLYRCRSFFFSGRWALVYMYCSIINKTYSLQFCALLSGTTGSYSLLLFLNILYFFYNPLWLVVLHCHLPDRFANCGMDICPRTLRRISCSRFPLTGGKVNP